MNLTTFEHIEPIQLDKETLAYSASSDETPRVWHPDGWCFRGVTTTLALAVSGMYGLLLTQALGLFGASVLLGAAIAWPAFLALVWTNTPSALRFARLDWGLWTMTVGSVAMTLGLLATALGSFVGWPALVTLLGGLVVADVAMGWVLTRYAPSVEVSRVLALAMWVGGMNGFLALFAGSVWLTRASMHVWIVPGLLFALLAPLAIALALAIYLGRNEPLPEEGTL